MRGVGLVVIASLCCGAACTTTATCATTCTSGCCDDHDQCQPGNSANVCGAGGARCAVCAHSCEAGACRDSNGTGGGGSDGGLGDAGVPVVMFVVDKSGSMKGPMDAANANCPSLCGAAQHADCPASCPTRWSSVTAALDKYLSTHGQTARFGLLAFPTDNACAVSSQANIGSNGVTLPTGADTAMLLDMQTGAVRSKLATLVPMGGTPTSLTLTALVGYPPLADATRTRLIVLLTDGVPNCNPNNDNTCQMPAACQCTLTSCAASTCAIGCLDRIATEDAEARLVSAGVKTAVVGIGSDFSSGPALTVLRGLGVAGGFERTCPTGSDAECTPGTCNVATHTCFDAHFIASSQADVEAALAAIVAP